MDDRSSPAEVAHRLFVCLTGITIPSPKEGVILFDHNRGELFFHELIESDIALRPHQLVEVRKKEDKGKEGNRKR